MFPTPFTLGHRVHSLGALDAHNNAVDAWADPVPILVHGVAPGASQEAVAAGRDVSSVAWTVYAPAGTLLGARDRVEWQGDLYFVNGEPRDYTFGPFGPFGGVVIELRRTEG